MCFYSHKSAFRRSLTSVPFFMSIMYGVSAVAVRALLSLYQRYVAGGTLSLSLQWSSSPEPTNTELGTSQDGMWGGTERARWWRTGEEEGLQMWLKGRILCCDRAQEVSTSAEQSPAGLVRPYVHTHTHTHRFPVITEDVEGHRGLSQIDVVLASSHLAAIFPRVLLGNGVYGQRGSVYLCPTCVSSCTPTDTWSDGRGRAHPDIMIEQIGGSNNITHR